jgi:hypothetical protein
MVYTDSLAIDIDREGKHVVLGADEVLGAVGEESGELTSKCSPAATRRPGSPSPAMSSSP